VALGTVEFLTVSALGAFPWIAARGLSHRSSVAAWREAAGARIALACGAWGCGRSSAASAFKLPHYALPTYPAIALLAAAGG